MFLFNLPLNQFALALDFNLIRTFSFLQNAILFVRSLCTNPGAVDLFQLTIALNFEHSFEEDFLKSFRISISKSRL